MKQTKKCTRILFGAPGTFSPDLDRLYLAVPDRGNQRAEIRVYQPE
jgi:hypothetical protein